ncbi:hypothetical protein DFH06DRAFT_1340645 [Mycena polygramma]|nr:hypothetical protein DFH06DRAFT_1340645 [Mycena polygramma]
MYLPSWSKYTIPTRGKLVPVQQSLADLLGADLAFLERQRRNIRAGELELARRQQNPSAPPIIPEPLTEDEESDESDREYTLPGGQPVDICPPQEYYLRPRPPRAPLADLTPIPEVVNGAHLDLLGFERIELCDIPRLFVDPDDRVGTIFIGPPLQRARWEYRIIEASNVMRIARAHLDRATLPGDNIRSGIEYDTNLKRPRRIDRAHNLSNMVVLASLRYSPAIQEITSFQNAMFRDAAPRAWAENREIIDAVVLNDCTLHLPMNLSDHPGGYQPTAFSEVEYRFSLPDSSPRREERDHSASFRAVTAIGNYHPSEGQLILWTHRKVVTFPPGSTFLLPGSLVRYSFTEVERPGWQMVVTQSCGAGLHDYVANNFDGTAGERQFSRSARREMAEAAVSLYSTVGEYDSWET